VTWVFGDAFYYLALLNKNDAAHVRAKAMSERLDSPVLTTAWVLTEVGDAFRFPPQRQAFLDLVQDLEADPEVRILPATEDLFQRGIAFYRRRSDKEWSLTDCISFVAMQEHSILDALTGDRHFEQAGFVPLLKA
jgi:predicted nucleic acid-binding protein